MTDKHFDIVSATRDLHSCAETINAQRVVISELRDQLEQTRAMLATAMSMNTVLVELAEAIPNRNDPKKRGRGRPKKIIDDTWMLAAFAEWRAEFVVANKFAAPTDNAVLTWQFEQMAVRQGLALRVRSPAFQRKLKTFRNRLSDVRNTRPKLPDK